MVFFFFKIPCVIFTVVFNILTVIILNIQPIGVQGFLKFMICFSDSQQEVEYTECFQKAFKFNLNMFLNNQIGFVGSIVFGKLEVLLCTIKETFIYIYIFFSCLVILKKDLNIFTKCPTSKYNLHRSDKLAIPHHITAFTESQVYS